MTKVEDSLFRLKNSFNINENINYLRGRNDTDDSINFMFWNIFGESLNGTFCNEFKNTFNIDICAKVETWSKNYLNHYD